MWQEDTEMPINLFEIAPLMILVLMPLPLPSSTAPSTAASSHKDLERLELVKDLLWSIASISIDDTLEMILEVSTLNLANGKFFFSSSFLSNGIINCYRY